MANIQTDDFTLTVAVGYNNMKALIDAASASITVVSYLWSTLMITNTGANACTVRRTGQYGTAPTSTTNGRNLAAGATFAIDARVNTYIDGAGIWIYSSAGTTIDVSIVRSGG